MRKLKLEELDRLSTAEFIAAEKVPVIIILDNIRSALNVGSVFRTADAFRLEAIYIVGCTATPPHRDILKSALGATESVTWQYFETIEECVAQVKIKLYKIISIEQTDNSMLLQDVNFLDYYPCAIILGNEVCGVSELALSASDIVIEIPQLGTKHSLNISVCAGIISWEAAKSFIQS
jgi:tRNA G18 (ribose-2'-O)-methylase SpoU